MKSAFRLASLFLLSALTLSACKQGASTANNPTADKPNSETAALPASPSPAVASASPTPTTAAGDQAYKGKNDLFEISFPKGYTYQETSSGVAFVSKDQGFGGSVDFGSAQGNKLTKDQLESALKSEYEHRLKNVKWQQSSMQPDGSIRVDWLGKDPDGNALDAVSFVEQHGDTIFILNLFGVNKSYQTYNTDAESIVKSYRVKQQ
jgi:hypothetical protein